MSHEKGLCCLFVYVPLRTKKYVFTGVVLPFRKIWTVMRKVCIHQCVLLPSHVYMYTYSILCIYACWTPFVASWAYQTGLISKEPGHCTAGPSFVSPLRYSFRCLLCGRVSPVVTQGRSKQRYMMRSRCIFISAKVFFSWRSELMGHNTHMRTSFHLTHTM